MQIGQSHIYENKQTHVWQNISFFAMLLQNGDMNRLIYNMW